ncbi:tetratricopeptide repeat protein [Ignavibacterium album]|uniref:tetratricopeptide repeat protein n=1 Tax=Ignavibacterium album TaxID=591197 RepID=UPI0002FC1478|nr:tetratricopeptide repeat protein [Ignavibacterium album]
MNIKYFNDKIVFGLLLFFIIIFSFYLFHIPLASTFGYEFAATFGVLFFLLSGLVNLWRLKKGIPSKVYFKFSLAILLLPILIALLTSFIKDICSFWFGVSFYLIIAAVSFVVSFFLSEIIYNTFPKFHKTIFFIAILIIAFIPVCELYTNPQVYFYSPIIGFFPGTVYDEDLSITLSLILYRALNLLYFSLFYFIVKRNFIKNKSITTLLLVIVALLFICISPEFGFSTDHKKLNKVLSDKIESQNFVIHFDKNGIDSTEINILLLNHEYYYEKLKNKLGFSPKEKINSFIFNDRLQKKRYFGSEKADVAKPWLNEIYLSRDSWESTLNHELVHIFSAEIGSGIFKLAHSFNPALIEGFAEAIDDNYDDIQIHFVAASAYNYGYKIDVQDLFRGFNFFKSFSGLSYLYAGSFSKYLIEKYGIESYSLFYHSGNTNKAFGKSSDELSDEYLEFLKSQKILLSKNQIEYFFGRQSIFQKVCPRQIASDLKEAEKLILQKKYSEAENLLTKILSKTSNYAAIIGLVNIYIVHKKYDEAAALISNHINEFGNTPYYYFLKLSEGDIQTLLSNDSIAEANYKFIAESYPHIQLKLLADLRIELQKNNSLKKYLVASDSIKFHILLELNKGKNVISSIIPMINLAEKIHISTTILLELSHAPLIPENPEDGYVLFRFSKYLLKKGDLVNARKLASLANRKSFGSVYYIAIKEQFEKCNWFVKNFERIIDNGK